MTDTKQKQQVDILYLGLPGSDFGFKIAGIKSIACHDSQSMLSRVKEIVNSGKNSIVFIDENLVESVQEDFDQLTGSATCSVVLLPSPTEPKRLAAKQMDKLMIQAVGSDIFNK